VQRGCLALAFRVRQFSVVTAELGLADDEEDTTMLQDRAAILRAWGLAPV
jgi:hypothetical protein